MVDITLNLDDTVTMLESLQLIEVQDVPHVLGEVRTYVVINAANERIVKLEAEITELRARN